ncbi:hypothetical protein V5738_10820 [Salinisphaera sp. SPP-AMP-43]|uniref:hypothetical protein n=1 Tax=Salinisphaera sp. SPP-AMP-43 TaxID=3121288 RepID=UPI003C6E103D
MSGDSGGSRVEETEAQQEQSRIAIDRYNDYQQRFAPLENRLMGEVRTTPAEYDQGTGNANAAAEAQFANSRDQYDQQEFARGVNPASGAYVSGMGGLKRSEALGTGENMASAGQALSDQEAYGLMGVTQLGRGQSTDAFNQYGQAANSAQSQAVSDARNALNESLANQQTFGQLTGAGASIAGRGLQSMGSSQAASGQQAGMPSGGYGGGNSGNASSGLTTTPSYSAGTRYT